MQRKLLKSFMERTFMVIELLWSYKLLDLGLKFFKVVIEMAKDPIYALIVKSKVIGSFSVHKSRIKLTHQAIVSGKKEVNLIKADKKEEKAVHAVLQIKKCQTNIQIERNLIVQKVQDRMTALRLERKNPVIIQRTNILVQGLDQNLRPKKAIRELKNTARNRLQDKK